MQSVIEQQVKPDTTRIARFAPAPEIVATARSFVAATCFDWGLPELADDAALAASELITNAIQHVRWRHYPTGARRITVGLCRTARRLTVTVRDPAKLSQPDLDGTEPRGNGLRIVQSLADEYGADINPSGGKRVWFSLSTTGHQRVLARALATVDARSDAEWTSWARSLLANNLIDGSTLAEMWQQIIEFDDTLAGYLADPVPVPERTVIVTGSGKETFKTFNVSTAAAILAAAAGARIVKGVSASVSAVSGSADILGTIGIPVLGDPNEITAAVCRTGLAFIPYASFCPRYAARYDGRFTDLSPMSFFMPTATLAVGADRFVHGLAHQNVATSAAGIIAARPDLATGRVITTRLSAIEQIDEIAGRGVSTIAAISPGSLTVTDELLPQAGTAWRRAVRHRSSHLANAAVFIDSLSPHGNPHISELVERNAAIILAAASPDLTTAAAHSEARRARESGHAIRLLQRLCTTREVTLR
jgi:anthranilate phosphoribosyltransferase